MILNLRAFWDAQRGKEPFMNETIPIINIDNLTLANFIRREIVIHHPSIKYNDSDIKSIKSGSGSNKTRILQYPASSCIESIKNESPLELNIVIARPSPQPAAAAAAPNPFERMMASSKPKQNEYKSKWEVDAVIGFLAKYEAAHNKAAFLSSLPKDGKPSIDDQHQAFAVRFLNDSGLGFKGGTGGEEAIAKNALRLMVGTLKFVNERRTTMGRSRVRLYDSSALLRDVKGCVSAKAKSTKENPLTKDMVMDQIKKVDNLLGAFPSSYYRISGSGDKYGEPILIEIAIWKKIIGEHHIDMIRQDLRNKKTSEKNVSNAPTQFNTEYRAIPSKP